MSTNLDSLDEIFSQPTRNARAGGKFAPKLKPRPKKETSKMLPSSQPVQNIISVGADTKKPSENNLNSGVESFNDSSLASSSSEHLIGEKFVDNNGPQTDVVLPEIHRKPIGEEALLNTEVDPLDDNEIKKASENNSDNNLEPGQGNADAGVEKSFVDVSYPNTTTTGSATSTDNDPWDEFFSPATRNEDPPAPDVPSVQTRLEDHIIIDDFPRDEEAVTDSDIGFHFNDGVLEMEEIETGPCMEGSETIFEMTTQSGQRSWKIQPTARSQADTREIGAASHPNGSGFVSCFDNDDFMSEIFSNEDLNNPAECSFGDAFCTEDRSSGFQETFDKSAEIRENNTSMACDDSLEHQETSVDGQDNEAGITIRKRRKRKNKYALVDENEDETHDVGNSGNENIEEHDRSEDGNEVERESQTEKKTKRSKKPSSHKEKRVRKRKNVNEAPDQATQKPPKKFSHSTRSNKRRVDKVLLETPEEDIDVRKLRMRDMLLLAEHREKAASKGGKTIEPPPADKSKSHDDHLEGEDLDKTQNTDYFNYHSYMKKTPRSRWSKQDTELFYEGVRQFGSDISMIQQLFPDRTRAQVKLKYKKEERQQPLRLHDALTNRSGDHSHFQRVIEQLKQLAAQENQNSFEDDSFDLKGNKEDATPEINENVDNLEKAEEREEGTEPDPSGAQSPPKSFYDSEDELSAYCQYKNPI